MEPNFQTSFIPKKPLAEEKVASSRSIGFLMLIAIIVFFTVLLASGGLYFYRELTKRSITKMENDLNLAKARFEPERIVQFQVLDTRLSAANQILSKHIAISPIFKILQDITMKTVQYTSFNYDLGTDAGAKVMVKMRGLTRGYRDVALQSDLFAKNSSLIDPVFSNLSLDSAGNVLFDLEFAIDPNLVNYKQNLGTVGTSSSYPTPQSTVPANPPGGGAAN